MEKFYVPKKYDNYADILITFGLVRMIRYALGANRISKIAISDLGSHFLIETEKDLSEIDFSKLKYEFILPYVEQNSKDRRPNPPEWASVYYATRPDKEFKDYTREDHIANNLQYSSQGLRATKGFNELCERLYENRKNYGQILKSFIESHRTVELDLNMLKETIGKFDEKLAKEMLKIDRALAVLFPQGGQGFNYEDFSQSSEIRESVNKGRQRVYTYELLLTTLGLWELAIFYPIFSKAGGKENIMVSVFTPKYIDIDNCYKVRDKIKGLYAGTPTKYNLLAILTVVIELIERSEELRDEPEYEGFKPSDFISSIETTTFRSLGSSFVPFSITKFVIPNWVFSDKNCNTSDLKESIDDIRKTIIYLDEKIVGIEIFTELVNFLNSEALEDLLGFLYQYNLYRLSQISGDKNKKIRSYSKKTLEVIMNRLDKTNKTEYSEILKKEGFKNITKAIHNVTAGAIYRARKDDSMKKFIHFGLASEFKRASLTKKTLIEWLVNFCSTYNADLDRYAFSNPSKEALPFLKVKQEDIEEVVKIIEECAEPKIVGGLLLAYGLASSKKEKDVLTEEETTGDS